MEEYASGDDLPTTSAAKQASRLLDLRKKEKALAETVQHATEVIADDVGRLEAQRQLSSGSEGQHQDAKQSIAMQTEFLRKRKE